MLPLVTDQVFLGGRDTVSSAFFYKNGFYHTPLLPLKKWLLRYDCRTSSCGRYQLKTDIFDGVDIGVEESVNNRSEYIPKYWRASLVFV